MHCAVPFFCARSGTEGEAAWRCGEWVVRAAGRASRSLRACVGTVWACIGAAWGSGSARDGRVAVRGREKVFGGEGVVGRRGMHRAACVGERKCAGSACRCAGTGEGFWRGMGGEGGEECIAQPAGVRLGCGDVAGGQGEGVRKCSGRACRCAWGSGSLRRVKGCEVGGECIAQPAGVRRDCVGERKCSGRACRCAGASEGLRRGMGCEVGGFNAHSPQQHARTRIIIYTSALSTP